MYIYRYNDLIPRTEVLCTNTKSWQDQNSQSENGIPVMDTFSNIVTPQSRFGDIFLAIVCFSVRLRSSSQKVHLSPTHGNTNKPVITPMCRTCF